MGRQNGLVPGGGSVTIESLLDPYQRPTGPQYWAQVLAPRQFCTSVFVQFAGAMPGKLDMIKGELLNIGVQTPPAEELASARGKAEVRYYWTSDVPVAQQIAVALGKFTRDGKPLRLTPLTDFPPAAKAKATTIEVWLDLEAPEAIIEPTGPDFRAGATQARRDQAHPRGSSDGARLQCFRHR